MKVETFADLIDWTRAMHHRLAECLAHCSTQSDDNLARMLLTYLADHETALEKIVDGFERWADPNALNTWVYDYLGHEPIDPNRACDAPFARMTFDEICASVFELHNQVTGLYRAGGATRRRAPSHNAGRTRAGASFHLLDQWARRNRGPAGGSTILPEPARFAAWWPPARDTAAESLRAVAASDEVVTVPPVSMVGPSRKPSSPHGSAMEAPQWADPANQYP